MTATRSRHGLISLEVPADVPPTGEVTFDPRPGAAQEGADGTDSVWVSFNAAGTVIDVSISGSWSRRLEPSQLGDAIFEAYGRAGAKVAAARRAGGESPGLTADHDGIFERGPDLDDPGWLGWVQETVGALAMRLDELERMDVTAADPSASPGTGRDVAGPQGFVRVRLSAGAVTGVLVDAPGYAVNAPDVVAQDALGALLDGARILAAGDGEEWR